MSIDIIVDRRVDFKRRKGHECDTRLISQRATGFQITRVRESLHSSRFNEISNRRHRIPPFSVHNCLMQQVLP